MYYMKTFKTFLTESKHSSELLFYFKQKHNKMMKQSFSATKEVCFAYETLIVEVIEKFYPQLHYITNEENTRIVTHISQQTKSSKLLVPNAENYITDFKIYSPEHYSYALDFDLSTAAPIIKFQTGTYSVEPEFQDNHIVYEIYEEIKDFLIEIISFLTKTITKKINVIHNAHHQLNTPDLFIISLDNKAYGKCPFLLSANNVTYLFWHIPEGLSEIKGGYTFSNYGLTSLPKNLPNVGKNFLCDNNKLTNLEGSPKIVSGIFNCSNNKTLISLKGAPESVGTFICKNDKKFTKEDIIAICKVKDDIIIR
jgi:hypothetical protein